jgi:hypothetical protein
LVGWLVGYNHSAGGEEPTLALVKCEENRFNCAESVSINLWVYNQQAADAVGNMFSASEINAYNVSAIF